MKYNYIFFNERDGLGETKDGYFNICVKDLEKHRHVQVISDPPDSMGFVFKFLYRVHNSIRINKIIPLPFRKMWYPFVFQSCFSVRNPLCFIVLGHYCSANYLRYVKRTYPSARIVKLHRDLIELWRKNMSDFTEEVCKELFDLRFTYDEQEAKKYHAIPFSEFESKIDIPVADNYPLSDVFFAGQAKDRLSRLIEAYRIFTEAGLKCAYYLTDVQKKDRVPLPGVTYADKQMTYREMLYRTVNSRCILEINQEGAVGYTSRFLEAVMYNKKLITNNVTIRDTKFYNPRYIQCVDDVRDIRPEFVTKDVGEVDYHYNDEFSPIHLIEQIDKELITLDAKEGRQ